MLVYVKRLAATVSILLVQLLPVPARAESIHRPAYQMTGYDLINTVNALRTAYGLVPYSINSILTFTAQNQADFMASTGQVTHAGPGGITLTQRLLAAGYPLSGDLSLGGFRAENITSGQEGMLAESAINGWMRDAPHQNTMLSPNLTEIGAGVAVANGRVYLVIDAARPTNAPNLPVEATSVVGSGTIVPAREATISPVIRSTANASGEVVHEVQYGQSLWQLAISYGVKIDDIKRLNGLFDNSIYPGNRLLIKLEDTPTPVPPTATALPVTTVVPTATLTAAPLLTPTATVVPAVPIDQSSVDELSWAIGIIVLAILVASAFAWRGSRSKAPKSR
jgi:LysM repeat protein